ncbi:MAG: nucleotidyl transferase AbiEii/AbiGii toxin family protein [Alphaproteobacteria bacterium]|nr:nucleotidyl transferase AbiEii/AbiGii toxin family protein [Alphaproteobacteria bacterium]
MSLNMDFFEQIAIEKGCDIAFPVKEHFLIQVIQQLVSRFYSAEGELIFGGGTSLVCAYDELTKRFSEDADFRFVPRPRSTANVRKTLMDIAHSLKGFDLIEEPAPESNKIEFRFVDTENIVQKHSSLRPYIKLEVFFTNNLFYEPQVKEISSFYDKLSGTNSGFKLKCVSLEDTTIDKISSFVWRILSTDTERSQYCPADMRHLHDLFFLASKIDIDRTFKSNMISVFDSDMKQRMQNQYPFDICVRDVIDLLHRNKQFKSDYEQYVANMSYAKNADRLSFEDACRSFEELTSKI